ncbi:MAG: hypothetical protein LBE62_00490 [Azonexus sp.]|jgi:hypothetical protein|nr:hypothetical protein [Azonexus sp.]
MLGKLARFIRSSTASPVMQDSLLTRIEVTVGNQIHTAPAFFDSLLPATKAALAYFERQVAALPGPLAMLPGPLFAHAGEISQAMGCSLAVKKSLEKFPADGEIHALLGMRRKPTAQNLADHTLHCLASSAEACREQICLAALDRLLGNFAEHLHKLQRSDRMQRMALEGDPSAAEAAEASPPPAELATVTPELMPENIVKGLQSWLAAPESYLRIDPPAAATDDAPALPLLHCSDRRQWLTCLVSFPAAEAAVALQNEKHNHRYILI